jgi:Fe-coproporphyrin III synthase
MTHAPWLDVKELQLHGSAALGTVQFHGNSMLPFLRDGDGLVVTPVGWDKIRVGDVITYRLDDRFPTGRVVRTLSDKLLLRVDNWPGRSFQVWPEDVLGKVVLRVRGGHELREGTAAWKTRTLAAIARYRLGVAFYHARRRVSALASRAHQRWLRRRYGYRELPVDMQVNVAAPCNLHCRMCPYLDVHSDRTHTRYMSRATFEHILPVVPLLEQLGFCGAGEPTLNKELPTFIRMVRERHPRLRINLTTNGTRLTDPLITELIDLRLDTIHVSIDGANPETVEAIRRGVDFSKVVDNLRRLQELKKERGSTRPVVMANYMLGYGTYREIADFVRLARTLGIAEIRLLEIQSACQDDFSNNLFNNLDRDGGRTLKEAIKLAERDGIRLNLPLVERDVCRIPFYPQIGEDGEVYPCGFLSYGGRQMYSDGRQVTLPGVSFGNVNRSTFKEIWESDGYARLRADDARGAFPDFCRACYRARIPTSDRVRAVLSLT